MTVMAIIFTLSCAVPVLLRILCVLDNMTSSTRWAIQWVYALEIGGIVAVVFQALDDGAPSWITLILLAGVTLAHISDSRIYPPRLIRRMQRGRRHDDIEMVGHS